MNYIGKTLILIARNPSNFDLTDQRLYRKYLSMKELDGCLLPLISQILKQQRFQTSCLQKIEHGLLILTLDSCKDHDKNEKTSQHPGADKKPSQQHSKPQGTEDTACHSSDKPSMFEKSSLYPDVTATTFAGGASISVQQLLPLM